MKPVRKVGVRVCVFEKMRMRKREKREVKRLRDMPSHLRVVISHESVCVVCAYVLSVYFRVSNEAKERLAYDIRYQSQSICPIKIKAPCYFELP